MAAYDTVFVVTCTTEDFGGTQTTVTQDVIAVYTSEDKAIAYCSLENIAENNRRAQRRAAGNPATSHSRWGYDEVTLVPGDTPMTTDRGPARGETDHLAAIRQMLDGQWDAHLEITGDERQAIMRHAEALAAQLAEAEARASRLTQYIMSIWEEEGETDPREVEANISSFRPGDLADAPVDLTPPKSPQSSAIETVLDTWNPRDYEHNDAPGDTEGD